MGSQIQDDVKDLLDRVNILEKTHAINRIDTVLPTDKTQLATLLNSVPANGLLVAKDDAGNNVIYQNVVTTDTQGKSTKEFVKVSVSSTKQEWDAYVDSLPTTNEGLDDLLKTIPDGGMLVVDKDSDISKIKDRIKRMYFASDSKGNGTATSSTSQTSNTNKSS